MQSIQSTPLLPNLQKTQSTIKGFTFFNRSKSTATSLTSSTNVAELSQNTYPEVNYIVQNFIYVDDCLTGEDGIDLAHHRADELEIVLNRGGFNLKGVSFSGEDPPSTLTEDGQMIFVGGMKWFVKEDMLSINIGELNFAKKHRGKKPSSTINVIPSKLTRRHCASKVAEIFDLTGKNSPITASMKMDLQELACRKLD